MHDVMALPLDRDGARGAEPGLVQAAQDDPAAFGALYERYLDRVYAYMRVRTRNADDAADLTQQVFLQALAALSRFHDQRVPFAVWLFRIARNSAIDFHRRRREALTWDLLPANLQPVAEGSVEGRYQLEKSGEGGDTMPEAGRSRRLRPPS